MNTRSPAGLSEKDEDTLFGLLEGSVRGAYIVGRPVPLLKRILKPDFTWEDARPGLTFPPLEYRVSRVAVERFLSIVRRIAPDASADMPASVPPLLFADEPNQCMGTLYAKAGRLQAGHRIEVLRSIPIGALVRSRAEVVDRFERSGRQFVEVLCTVYIIVDAGSEQPAVRIWATLLP